MNIRCYSEGIEGLVYRTKRGKKYRKHMISRLIAPGMLQNKEEEVYGKQAMVKMQNRIAA